MARVPIACTLQAAEMPDRLDDWRAVLAHATQRTRTDAGMRVDFADDVPVDKLATLMAAERGCCQFFSFALTVDDRGVGLDVTTPPEGVEVAVALFG